MASLDSRGDLSLYIKSTPSSCNEHSPFRGFGSGEKPANACISLAMAQYQPRKDEIDEKAIDDWLPITSSRKAKWWYSTFHNVTAMVGAGVLSLPYSMAALGW